MSTKKSVFEKDMSDEEKVYNNLDNYNYVQPSNTKSEVAELAISDEEANANRLSRIETLEVTAKELEEKTRYSAKCTAHTAYRICSLDKLGELKNLISINDGDLLFIKSTEGRIDDDTVDRYRVYAYHEGGRLTFIGDVAEWLE